MPLSSHPLIALILSGGGGTRLWPVSTDAKPKQFLRLFGKHSLFQNTLSRTRAAGMDHAVIVANVAHEALIADEVATLATAGHVQVLLEPMRRDSAPAIAAGVAAVLQKHGRGAIVVALPCDHLIPDHAHFGRAVAAAARVAQHGKLVTFGIKLTFASSDFGYIQQGETLANETGETGAFSVAAFVEKPDAATAQRYLAVGGYHWNSGMFVFTAGTFADEAERHMPDVWEAACAAVGEGDLGACIRLDEAAFGASPRISIDYALFEKSDRVAVVPVDFSWSDVGAWNAVLEALPQDDSGNATVGTATLTDSTGSLAIGQGIRVVALGLEDFVVVASPEGVFIAPKNRAAEIKALLMDYPNRTPQR